jgi:hypothetical protein
MEKIADIPWGLLIFIFLIFLLLFHVLARQDVAVATAGAGLFAVGHGIHTGSKHLH